MNPNTLKFALLFCVVFIGLATHVVNAQENWKQTNGPFGGSVSDIVMWSDSGIAVGTFGYVTTNDGESWTKTFPYTMAHAMVDSGGKAWISGSYYNGNPMAYSGNHGASWSFFPPSSPGVQSVFSMLTTSPGHRLAMRGIYNDSVETLLSCDDPNALKWTVRPMNGIPKMRNPFDAKFALNPISHSLVFVGFPYSGPAGLTMFRSTDLGFNWTTLPLAGIPDTHFIGYTSADFNAVSIVSNGTEFISTSLWVANAKTFRFYRSTDDGNNWLESTTGLSPFTLLQGIVRTPAGNLFATETNIDNNSTGNIEELPQQVAKSTDDGITWEEPANAGLPQHWINQLYVTPRGTLLATGTGGLFRSSDEGANWELSVNGLNNAEVYYVVVDSAQEIFASLIESGIYRSSDKGASWTRLTNGIPGAGTIALSIAPNGNVFAGGVSNGMFRSTDRGDTWTSQSNGLASTNVAIFNITPRGTLVAFGDHGVYRSTNNGDSWIAASTSIPTSAQPIDMNVRKDGLLLCETFLGPYFSTDEGDHWSIRAAGLSQPDCYSACFLDDGTIIMGNANTIVRSTDNGMHWVNSGIGVPQEFLQTGVGPFIVRHNGRILASVGHADTFMIASTDNGFTWKDDRTGGLSSWKGVSTYCFAEDKSDNLFASGSSGIWTDNSATAVAERIPMSPTELHLSAAPNPVNTDVAISFEISEPATIQMTMYDLLGRVVLAEPCARYAPGSHVVALSTTTLVPGMYRCELKSGSAMQTISVGVVR